MSMAKKPINGERSHIRIRKNLIFSYKCTNPYFMQFAAYQQLFLDILNNPIPPPPYNDPHYMNYVKLNHSREQRWLKVGILNEDTLHAVKNIQTGQLWTVITEPWCGDAAHTLPFLQRLAAHNPLIKVDYQLRDSPPYLIDHYLTNGKKSIPKLIITEMGKKEPAIWGPRPAACQLLFEQLRNNHVDADEVKIELQKWYNDDKGESFQRELFNLINQE
jgi:hypothetical protein